MNNLNKKTAFSLAETLIAVLIIGVLAAILIPAVSKLSPDKSKVVLRKAYTNLAQAVTTMINDDVNYPGGQVDTTTNVPRGFNYTTPTSNGSTNKFCYFLADLLNTVGTTHCPDTSATGMITTNPIFTTSDGITWYLRLGGDDSTPNTQFKMATDDAAYATQVIIDVNGPNRGSNCMADPIADTYKPGGGNPAYSKCLSSDAHPEVNPCFKSPDTFLIGIRYDGKLYAGSRANHDYCAESILSNPADNTKQGS